MYGADRMLLQVLDAFRGLDVDVEVWLPCDVAHAEYPLCDRLTELGHDWQHVRLPILRRARLGLRGSFGLGLDWLRTLRRLRSVRPHAVYLGSSACLLIAPAARVTRVPMRVLHLQERWTGRSATLLRALARSTTARLAISDYVASSASLRNPPAVVVANCVDDASTRVAAHAEPELRGDDHDALVFVVASRWNRWKGHATLLRAWERAGCPGRLVVLGGPPPTGDGTDVRRLTNDIVSRPETVELVGEVPDIAPFVARGDVLVLPSDEPEPFGLVVIEAFSLGRPVVASRAGGPTEIIDDGRTGWLYEIGDSNELAAVLGRLRPAVVAEAGRRARAVYERSYTPDRYLAELRGVLATELSRAGRDRGRPWSVTA